ALEVDDDEGGLGEAAHQRVVDARTPARVGDVEAEAAVVAEERGDETGAELGIPALRGEDEVEQLRRRRAGRAVGEVLVQPLPEGAQKEKNPLRFVGAPGDFSRVATVRSSSSKRSSSARCRPSNCSISRRRRSRKSWNDAVHCAWKRASASST